MNEERRRRFIRQINKGVYLDFWRVHKVWFYFSNLHCGCVEKTGVKSKILGSNNPHPFRKPKHQSGQLLPCPFSRQLPCAVSLWSSESGLALSLSRERNLSLNYSILCLLPVQVLLFYTTNPRYTKLRDYRCYYIFDHRFHYTANLDHYHNH